MGEISMGRFVGIDFGTSNSSIAGFDGRPQVLCRDENDLLPSVVAVRGDGTLVIGHEAKLIFNGTNGRQSVKRILGRKDSVKMAGGSYDTLEIATLIFGRLKAIAEEQLGEEVTHAVVTVPANSKGAQRHATGMAANIAGLSVIALINEPTAAAMAYGLDSNSEQTVLVYDFGGGTFDVTILKLHNGVFEELSSKGVAYLGGDDIDVALLNQACAAYADSTGGDLMADVASPGELRYLFEQAKIRLTTQESTSVWVEELGFRHAITREGFNGLISGFLERTIDPMEVALRDAGLGKADITSVLMVGGTSKIPAVRDLVSGFFGRDIVATGVDPMTCVAQGAAIAAAIVQDTPGMEDYAYSVKLEHSLCAEVYDPRLDATILSPIIHRGRDIPCKDSMLSYPASDFIPHVDMGIYEGDDYVSPESPENMKLGEIRIPIKPPRVSEDAPMLITYRYSADGLLSVSVTDKNKGKTYDQAIQFAGQEVTADKLAGYVSRAQARLASSKEYPDAAFALRRWLERVQPNLSPEDDDDAADALAASAQLAKAMEDGDADAIGDATAELNAELVRFSYLF